MSHLLKKSLTENLFFLQCYECIRSHINSLYKSTFLSCQLATVLHHSCLKIIIQLSTSLQFHVSFWVRNNEKYLKIDIYYKHTSTLPFQASVIITSKPFIDLHCKWFLYNGNTANLRLVSQTGNTLHVLFVIYWRHSSPFSPSNQS